MAEFEGKSGLNDELPEIELADDILENVVGGVSYPESAGHTYQGYNVVDGDWGPACAAFGHTPDYAHGGYQPDFCKFCRSYRSLETKINNWDGYCTWDGSDDVQTGPVRRKRKFPVAFSSTLA